MMASATARVLCDVLQRSNEPKDEMVPCRVTSVVARSNVLDGCFRSVSAFMAATRVARVASVHPRVVFAPLVHFLPSPSS